MNDNLENHMTEELAKNFEEEVVQWGEISKETKLPTSFEVIMKDDKVSILINGEERVVKQERVGDTINLSLDCNLLALIFGIRTLKS